MIYLHYSSLNLTGSTLLVFVIHYFNFKVNLIIIQLEHIVDRVMVPLNRVFPMQPHFPLGKAFIRFVVMPLVGASNEGRLWACGTLAW